MLRALYRIVAFSARLIRTVFTRRERLILAHVAACQQLAVYERTRPRPRLDDADRAFWIALKDSWPKWRDALVIVKPKTVVGWHRQAFRSYWRRISTSNPGRPLLRCAPDGVDRRVPLQTRCPG